MSETFRVGDEVVFRNSDGVLLDFLGSGEVVGSDLSTVTVLKLSPLGEDRIWKFNAGTLRFRDGNAPDAGIASVVSHLKPSDVEIFKGRHDLNARTHELCGLASYAEQLDANDVTLEQIRAAGAILEGKSRQCNQCRWWRPPFAHGPGNCHNSNLIALTRANDDGFPPPTPATFGCVHWETREQPENGDDSDE